jgi:beta-lactamase regulating signal transducer with metallopeptidase domain
MRVPLRHIPPFFVLALAASAAAAAIGALFAVAVNRGAPAHAAGMLLKACTSLLQVAGGVVSLALLSLPLLLVLAGLLRGALTQVRTTHVLRDLRSPGVLRPPELLQPATAAGLRDRVDVVAREELVALTHGLLRPRVLLSRGAVESLTPAELQAVLAHEAVHVTRRDPLRLLAAEVASSAFFIFPLVRELARHFVLATELAADRAAVAIASRTALASGLLKFIDTPRHRALPGLALEATNEARVAALLHPADSVDPVRLRARAIHATILNASAIAAMAAVLFALPPML